MEMLQQDLQRHVASSAGMEGHGNQARHAEMILVEGSVVTCGDCKWLKTTIVRGRI